MSLKRGQQNENNIGAAWIVFSYVNHLYRHGTRDYHLGRSEEKEMRVINVRAGVRLESMAEGETFEINNSHWIVSGYVDDNDNTLCVSLESGKAEFVPRELIVMPVTAEVRIL